jgi:hypothetical protein
MANLFEAFEIEFPPGVDRSMLATLQEELAETDGVDQCDQSTTRSLDPATITMWVTLIGSTITALGGAVPVVKQIIDLLKRKGIKGAKLVLANGSVLHADEISVEDLLKLEKKS